VPDVTRKLSQGAIAPWAKSKSPYQTQTIEAIAKHFAFDKTMRWKDLPGARAGGAAARARDRGDRVPLRRGGRVYQVRRPFEGIIPNMERRYKETDSAWVREEFEQYQNQRPCHACGGYRLKPEALAVKIGGLHVGQVVEMSIRQAFGWVQEVPGQLSNQKNEIARAILKEIRERLGFSTTSVSST
jgi:excinuclease ABC subunit A